MQAQITLIPSAARTATNNTIDYVLGHSGYGRFVIDVTAVPGVDTVTFTVQGKDNASGKYFTLLASAAISAISTVTLEVGPTITAAANASANKLLSETFRVLVTHSAGTSFTYSVGLDYVVR